MISRTMERAIDRRHDKETARILDRQRQELQAAATPEQRDAITRGCIAALRRAFFDSCDARGSLTCSLS